MPDEDSSQRRSADLNLLAQFRCPNCAPDVKGPYYNNCIFCPFSPFSPFFGHQDSKADVQKSHGAKAQPQVQIQVQSQPLVDPPPRSFWPEPEELSTPAPAPAPVQAARPTIAVQAAPPRPDVAIVSVPPRRTTRGRPPLAVQYSTAASRCHVQKLCPFRFIGVYHLD